VDLCNPSNKDVRVRPNAMPHMRPQTKRKELWSGTLSIVRGAEVIRYIGRSAECSLEPVVLKPKERIVFDVELTENYRLERGFEYWIVYDWPASMDDYKSRRSNEVAFKW
jgi:hypothetical protein